MATNYTGLPTATEAPAAAPAPDGAPIVVLPADGDPPNAAAFAQAYKVLADYVAWIFKPRAKLNDLAKEIISFRNALTNRRAGYDHQGLPTGLFTGWDENWCDNGFTPKTVVGTGLWGKGWTYEVGVSGSTLGGGGITVLDQTAGGGGIVTGPRSALLDMNPFPNAPGVAWTLVEYTRACAVLTRDTATYLEWEGFPGSGTSGSVGFGDSQVGISAESTGFFGFGVVYRAADTNYQLYTNDGTTTTFTDTGVAKNTASRFRLEYQGTNEADGGAGIASVRFDGGSVTSHAVDFVGAVLRPFLRARNPVNTTSPGFVGVMRFRINLGTGDHLF